ATVPITITLSPERTTLISSTCKSANSAEDEKRFKPVLRPMRFRRQRHQDRFGIATSHQAKSRATVINQIKFDISSTADQLLFFCSRVPGLIHRGTDNRGIDF